MIKTLLLISALVLSGLSAQAQYSYSGKKLYIVNQSQRKLLKSQSSLAEALNPAERLEVTATAAGNQVQIQKCGPAGCQDALNSTIPVDQFSTATNQVITAQIDQDCRVCTMNEELQLLPKDVDVDTFATHLQNKLIQIQH
jgi:hypothetical protein